MIPITMILSEGKEGADICGAFFHGREFAATSRNGATMRLARQLVEAGAPDGPVEARGADGRLRFTSPSLHGLARWTIEEGDRGIRQRRWKPSPMGGEAPQDGVSGSALPTEAAEAEAA